MALETRTLPGAIVRERGGAEIAAGWCIIAYETGQKYEPLDDWRGEMTVKDNAAREAINAAAGDVLYLQCQPYGGEFESWHGPVVVELVESPTDPYERRAKLRAAGALIRSDRAIPDTGFVPPYARNLDTNDAEGEAR